MGIPIEIKNDSSQNSENIITDTSILPVDLSPDIIPIQTLDDLIKLQNQNGYYGSGTSIIAGAYQSPNFVSGSTGWRLLSNGTAEFSSGTFRGSLIAASIDIPNTTTANSFHVDTSGNTWWGATTLGASVASVTKAGVATFVSGTVGGWSLSSTQLQSTSSNIILDSSAKTITVGTGDNQITLNGSTGNISANGGAWQLSGNGNVNLKFGGTGVDGALTITSGTTTVSLGNAQVVYLNYTSISITGTGKLGFSNPATTGTVIILRSQGNVTLTSSASGNIDAGSMGAGGGSNNGIVRVDGTESNEIIFNTALTTNGKTGADRSNTVTVATAGYTTPKFYTYLASKFFKFSRNITSGNGGGAGGAGLSGGTGAGNGGAGGGGLIIECAGAWNFTSTNGISIAGGAGGNGSSDGGGSGYGGGGGGAGGWLIVLYNTLTANSGTVNISGGNGGIGGNGGGSGTNGGAGGSGGGMLGGGGGTGAGGANSGGSAGSGGSGSDSLSTSAGHGTGGAGGSNSGGGGGGGGTAGEYFITQNTFFA